MTASSGGSDLSRRSFLKGSALTVGGFAASSLLAACGANSTSSVTKSGKPRRGGNLHVGFTGGSSSDTLDADKAYSFIDHARGNSLYDALVTRDSAGQPALQLAKSITALNSKATRWRIELVDGVEFHNGKSLTVDDVIFTFKRIADPKNPLAGSGQLAPIDLSSLRKVSPLVMEFNTTIGYSSLIGQLSTNTVMIVPENYNPKQPVGTGPFKLRSFTAGQQSVMTRNPNYWQHGVPYVDTLTIVDFADATALANALTGGELDAIGNIEAVSARQLQASGQNSVIVSKSGAFTPFTMRVDRPPFNDVRVRQAMRLLVDRQQMIDSSLGGYGVVASDVFSPFDPLSDPSLKRVRDVDEAKSLLKRAGHENLQVALTTSDIANGTTQAAEVLAQQAEDAGVQIKLTTLPPGTFYGSQYLRYTFAQDYWLSSTYLTQVAEEMLPSSPYNETHWNNPRYNELYKLANSTTDETKQREYVQAMQLLDFNEGGLIIPSFNDNLDAVSSNVHGAVPSKSGAPFNNYRFDLLWLA